MLIKICNYLDMITIALTLAGILWAVYNICTNHKNIWIYAGLLIFYIYLITVIIWRKMRTSELYYDLLWYIAETQKFLNYEKANKIRKIIYWFCIPVYFARYLKIRRENLRKRKEDKE